MSFIDKIKGLVSKNADKAPAAIDKVADVVDDKTGKKHNLLGIFVNLSDYTVGSTKGGEITHFTDFDIDFNQEKSLLETRCSGANTRVMSAIALEEDVTANIGG